MKYVAWFWPLNIPTYEQCSPSPEGFDNPTFEKEVIHMFILRPTKYLGGGNIWKDLIEVKTWLEVDIYQFP